MHSRGARTVFHQSHSYSTCKREIDSFYYENGSEESGMILKVFHLCLFLLSLFQKNYSRFSCTVTATVITKNIIYLCFSKYNPQLLLDSLN